MPVYCQYTVYCCRRGHAHRDSSMDSLSDQFNAFSAAINWKEPLIVGILVFHVLLLLMIVIGRRIFAFQVGVLSLMAVTCIAARTLNATTSRNWRSFATQNYFDKQGIFVTIFIFVPVGVLLLLQTVLQFCIAARLAVISKTQQLKRQQQHKQKDS